MKFFKTKGQEFGDSYYYQMKYAMFPVKCLTSWTWRKHYYIVTRTNSFVPPMVRDRYTEVIKLTSEEFLIFKLTF